VRLYAGKQTVATVPVYKGAANSIKAGFITDLQVALPAGSRDKLQATVQSTQPLIAPISVGQAIGTMRITLGGQPYREIPVVALEEVPVAGIFGRGWDALRLLFR
jgi:D-alanyl-D-alanine carboxypeptidase (penicillin-binding protein 5/6)